MERATRKAILALIALSELPTPWRIRFEEEPTHSAGAAFLGPGLGDDQAAYLILSFNTLTQLDMWAAALGAQPTRVMPPETDEDRSSFAYADMPDWHGWRLKMNAREIIAAEEPLADDLRQQLVSGPLPDESAPPQPGETQPGGGWISGPQRDGMKGWEVTHRDSQ